MTNAAPTPATVLMVPPPNMLNASGAGPNGEWSVSASAPGVSIAVPAYAVVSLLAGGWTFGPASGTTANRPTDHLVPGVAYFDSTLGKPIWRNAANTGWVDATGTAA